MFELKLAKNFAKTVSFRLYRNNKSGKDYVVLYDKVIECTNGMEGIEYVVYRPLETDPPNIYFCRERKEFLQKFTEIKAYDTNSDTIRALMLDSALALARGIVHPIKE